MDDKNPDLRGRIAGGVLIATAILAIVGMLHHPVGGGPTPGALADSIAHIAGPARLVHGALIGVQMVLLYALVMHAVRRGVERPVVMAGLVAYAVGAVAMLLPAIIDGFVLVDLAERAGTDADMLAVFTPLFVFALAIAMAFAKLATVLMSLGICFFSVDLMHSRGAARWVGLLGVVMGMGVAVGVLLGVVALDRAGMTSVVATWGVWYAALGVLLLTKRA